MPSTSPWIEQSTLHFYTTSATAGTVRGVVRFRGDLELRVNEVIDFARGLLLCTRVANDSIGTTHNLILMIPRWLAPTRITNTSPQIYAITAFRPLGSVSPDLIYRS